MYVLPDVLVRFLLKSRLHLDIHCLSDGDNHSNGPPLVEKFTDMYQWTSALRNRYVLDCDSEGLLVAIIHFILPPALRMAWKCCNGCPFCFLLMIQCFCIWRFFSASH